MQQSELVDDFKEHLKTGVEAYYTTLRDPFDKDAFNRLIRPHLDDMLVKIEERIENILEDELLSDSFTGE